LLFFRDPFFAGKIISKIFILLLKLRKSEASQKIFFSKNKTTKWPIEKNQTKAINNNVIDKK